MRWKYELVTKKGKRIAKFRLMTTAMQMKAHYEKIHLQKLKIVKIE